MKKSFLISFAAVLGFSSIASAQAGGSADNAVDKAADEAAAASAKAAAAPAPAPAAAAPAPAPADAAGGGAETVEPNPPAPPKPAYVLAGNASLAVVWLTGNANALTGSANLGMTFEYEAWRAGLKGQGVYGVAKTGDADRNSVTASAASLELKVGRAINSYIGAYALGLVGYDRVGKIDWRAGGEGGLSGTFLKVQEGDLLKRQLTLELGARYVREQWYQFYPDKSGPSRDLPDVDIVYVRVGAAFRYAFDARTSFTQTLDILPDVLTPENFNLVSGSALQVRIWGPLAISTNFIVKFDNLPPPGAQKLDTQLTVAVDLTF